MRLILRLFLGLGLACLTAKAAPSVDVSNAPVSTAQDEDINPLAPAPLSKTPPPPQVDEDAADLMSSPGLIGSRDASHDAAPSEASQDDVESTAHPDIVNGDDSNPLQINIRRAKLAPTSSTMDSVPAPPPVDPLPQKSEDAPAGGEPSPDGGSPERVAQVETAPSVAPAPALTMKLRLNDLVALQKAAEDAGGSLQITVATVGVNPEDLILPLRKQGFFNVVVKEGSFLVSSKIDSLGQIDALTNRRRQLLEQIAELDAEMPKKNAAPTEPPSSTPVFATGSATSEMPVSTAPAELILTVAPH
jgi:hypothetical protein